MTSTAVIAHVGAGALWLLVSLAIAATGRTPRWLAGLQLAAALAAVLAGIHLWHARHAGPQGPVEHLLTIGSFCALVTLGLQLPIALPALRATPASGRLERGALLLSRAGCVLLAGAAAAMLASLYA